MTQHTHDEIKAWIDQLDTALRERLEEFERRGDEVEIRFTQIAIQQNLANRAGLERHEPKRDTGCERDCEPSNPICPRICRECPKPLIMRNTFIAGPRFCPTYTDIYNEIRSVM